MSKVEKKSSINLPVLSQDANLIRYLEEIKKFPMLTAEEEFTLAKKWQNNQDVEAAQKLVTSHLRYVAKIAMQFRGYGLPMTDIIAEGNIGLMTAVKKFDPDKGFRLSTYSIWWIKATIQDYVLKSWSMVKMGTSAAHKKLFFNLRKIRTKLLYLNNGQIPHNESELIAQELDVSRHDVDDMRARMSGADTSLNSYAHDNEDGGDELLDTVSTPVDSHELTIMENNEYAYRKKQFQDAMSQLNEREQEIIYQRRLIDIPETLESLGSRLGISSERVRQVEEKALQKLRQAVKYENNNQ